MPYSDRVTWEIKAAALHGTIELLKKRGLFESVRAEVSPAVRSLMDEPPARTAWVACLKLAEIDEVLLRTKGRAYLRAFSKDAAMVGAVPAMLTVIQGMFRLFGATPNTIFTRVIPLLKGQTHEIEHSYERVDDRSGRLSTRYEGTDTVPEAMLVAFSGVVAISFDVCRVSDTGVIGEHEARKERDHTLVQWDVRW